MKRKSGPKKIWTPEEDRKLKIAIDQGISPAVVRIPRRTSTAKYQRAAKLRSWAVGEVEVTSQNNANFWTPEEDQKIRDYKARHVIYRKMRISGRTWSAIKYRWLNYLHNVQEDLPIPHKKAAPTDVPTRHPDVPTRHKMVWTAEEDKMLWRARQDGQTFSEINIPGRSPSALKNRWEIWVKNLTEFKSSKTPDLTQYLQDLCHDYTLDTLPTDLGNYCYLLDQAAKLGWIPTSLRDSSASFSSESPTEAKILTIDLEVHLLLKVQSKISIWRRATRRVTKSGPPHTRHQKIKKFLLHQYFDAEGNEIPNQVKETSNVPI